jgi:peroxiredoxin
MKQRTLGRFVLVFVALFAASCGKSKPEAKAEPKAEKAPPAPPKAPASGSYGAYGSPGQSQPAQITFKDVAPSNAEMTSEPIALNFVDNQGQRIDLTQYRGQKNVVLVVTRGFPGAVCPFCSAQTSRLIGNYREFGQRQAEVLVVFPGPSDHIQDFIQASQTQAANAPVPFPILLDANYKVVDELGIRADLAKPSTYILDKKGEIRYAYVGSNPSDRPSVKVLLLELDKIQRSR